MTNRIAEIEERYKNAKNNDDLMICGTDVPYLLSALTQAQRERDVANEYRTPQKVEPGEDRPFCPRCSNEIVGYYANYCEHCGQALDMSDDGS